MIEQIYSPVLWVDCIAALLKAGVDTCVECGPGKVLSGLTKRIDRNVTSLGIEAPDALKQAVDQLSV
jgi:[acyl-carrier-protein] S-malonyltransferase